MTVKLSYLHLAIHTRFGFQELLGKAQTVWRARLASELSVLKGSNGLLVVATDCLCFCFLNLWSSGQRKLPMQTCQLKLCGHD